MDSKRLTFRDELASIAGDMIKLYYQPPDTVRMTYPCIVYSLSDVDLVKANDSVYINNRTYRVQYIDRSTSMDIPEKLIEGFQFVKFIDRSVIENLNHTTLEITY